MIEEINQSKVNGHDQIAKAQKRFQEVYERFSEGTGLVTPRDLYRAILEVNQAKLNFGNLDEVEREIRKAEIEKITSLLEEMDTK